MSSILCPRCGQQNDHDRVGAPCWKCGQPLPILSLDIPQEVAAGPPLPSPRGREVTAPRAAEVARDADAEPAVPDIRLPGTPPSEGWVALALILPVSATVVSCALRFSSADYFPAALAINCATVFVTAILMAVDASALGCLDRHGKQRESAATIFFGTLLFWVLIYPLAFFRRRHFGRPNLGPLALIVAVLFVGLPMVVPDGSPQPVAVPKRFTVGQERVRVPAAPVEIFAKKTIEEKKTPDEKQGAMKNWPGVSEVRQFTGHTDGVITVAVSPDGRHALSGSWKNGADRIVRLWDVETAKELLQLRGHTGAITCVAFSPDGTRALAGGLDRTVRLWELDTGRELKPLTGHGGAVYAALFSRDGKLAVSAAHEPRIRIWDLAQGAPINTLTGHNGPVRGLALSVDGKRLASAGFDGRVCLWEFPSGKAGHTLAVSKNQVNAVAFSPDGSRLVAGGDDRVLRLFDVKTGKERRRFVGHSNVIHTVAFTTDGKRVLSGSYDRTLRLWDADTGNELRRFAGHQDLVLGVACTPDGRHALSASYDRTVRVWRLPSGEGSR